jgi:Family of unknown function (DUF6489)
MKFHVEVDCTPEEARTFLGFPDVSKANAVYVDAVSKAMKGVSDVEKLQDYAQQLAPMGQVGMKLFQQFMENGPGALAAMASAASKGGRKRDED